MKKIISITLAVLMLVSLSLSSFAATKSISGDANEMNKQKTGDTIVKTDIFKDINGDVVRD
jgi:hypothetical protein